MSFFSWIGGFFKDEVSSPKSLDDILELLGGLTETSSGVNVTPKKAVMHSTVYSCVKVISETVAQLPCVFYENVDKDGQTRQRAKNHHLYDLLKNSPNDFMTSFEFWQFMTAAVCLRGMGCAYKVMVGNKVKELIPIGPDSIDEIWDNGKQSFNITFANGKQENVSPEDVFCVKGLTLDGKTAVSPIKYMANMIGLSISAQKHTSLFFKNGARPAGVLKAPGVLDQTVVEGMKKSWQEAHGGANKGKVAVLHGGLDYQSITMSPEDSQLLELMGFNRTEICGIFGVPPFMVGAIDKTSSWGTGLSEQSLGFIRYTISPYLTRTQQRITKDILSGSEQKRYYAEFLTDQFLRGDAKARNESYKSALGGTQHPGYMTQNEIRKLENLPPIDGGDELYTPKSNEKVVSNEQEK